MSAVWVWAQRLQYIGVERTKKTNKATIRQRILTNAIHDPFQSVAPIKHIVNVSTQNMQITTTQTISDYRRARTSSMANSYAAPLPTTAIGSRAFGTYHVTHSVHSTTIWMAKRRMLTKCWLMSVDRVHVGNLLAATCHNCAFMDLWIYVSHIRSTVLTYWQWPNNAHTTGNYCVEMFIHSSTLRT